ncbi:unnamed protein product [Effrenium voratum]|nr:unnamed protein product [Effrenium voratum]
MATSSERINGMFANSSTWRSKEEEQKGRAALHTSQVNRYSAANARAFAGTTVSQEDLEKERQAAQKRKAAENLELNELLEAQKAESVKGQTLRIQAKAAAKKEKKMPFLVKKLRAETEAPAAEDTEATEATEADAMISEFLRPEFRYKLRDALTGSEGDMVKQAHARRDVCMAVEIPLLAKYGYDDSEEAVHQHSMAMASLLHDCPDLVAKNLELARLVNPTMDVDEDAHITAD